jgi:membrane protein involved in colicin uptake
MMTNREWAGDSFWESYDQNRITSVLMITDDEGRVTKQQLTVNRYNPDGTDNPDFQEIISQLTEEKITENTQKRNEKRAAQREMREQQRLEREKAAELQKLFEAKIQAFEIEDIKNSKNRVLKSKLRKAKNLVEVNIYSMMIVMEELENGTEGTE